MVAGCSRSWYCNWASSTKPTRWRVQCFPFLCCMTIIYFEILCCMWLLSNSNLRLQDLLGLEGDDLAQFKALVGERYTWNNNTCYEFPMDSCELFNFVNVICMASSYVRTSQMMSLYFKSKTTFWRTWYLLTQTYCCVLSNYSLKESKSWRCFSI